MRTFKIRQIAVPETAICVELEPKSFKQLIQKLDRSPVLESKEGLFYVHEDGNIVYWCKKEEKRV